MANPAPAREIRLAVAARLAAISTAAGYHTNAGADVRNEPRQGACAAPFLGVWATSIVRMDEQRSTNERELTLMVEGQLPVEGDNALELAELMADDVEVCLDGQSLGGALPMLWTETVFLERPDGLPVMAFQSMFTTRFRR